MRIAITHGIGPEKRGAGNIRAPPRVPRGSTGGADGSADAMPPPGSYEWLVTSLYTPGVSVNATDLSRLFDWQSQATAISVVTYPEP